MDNESSFAVGFWLGAMVAVICFCFCLWTLFH